MFWILDWSIQPIQPPTNDLFSHNLNHLDRAIIHELNNSITPLLSFKEAQFSKTGLADPISLTIGLSTHLK